MAAQCLSSLIVEPPVVSHDNDPNRSVILASAQLDASMSNVE